MVPPITLLAAFAAIFVAQAAHGLRFEGGHTFEYKYNADVKVGTDETAAYASEFLMEATLHFTEYNVESVETPPRNVFHVQLLNVQHGLYNGEAQPGRPVDTLIPIGEDVAVLHQPFFIIYEPNGMLHGVKIPADEPIWSKNMKIAIASMLQLDLAGIDFNATFGRQNFVTQEPTIYGKCSVTYDALRQGVDSNDYVIMKSSAPTNCTSFDSRFFNHVDVDSCQPMKEESLSVNSRRLVDVHKTGEEIRINKLFAENVIKYVPWNRITRPHYAITSAALVLDKVLPKIEIRAADFQSMPLTLDLSNQKPEGRYAPNAAIDPTHGRHVVDPGSLVPELRQMLEEVVDYVEENHLKAEEPNWKHGHTINRILRTMSLMDIPSLELIFHAYQDSKDPRDVLIKTLFFDMLPQVGTPATSVFTMRLVRKSKVPEDLAIAMLKNLPPNVKSPSPKLLQQLEDLLRFDGSVSIYVQKASILCFSSLIHRTFRDLVRPADNLLLQKYLRKFLTRIRDEPSYEMKIVYLMAIRNVEVGDIHRLLAPIITGELTISKDPMHARLLAIWAVEKSIAKDLVAIDILLYPIMANVALPLKLRVAAYDIMIRVPDEDRLNRIDLFMVTETNKHFLNYHYTTVRHIAEADDPCMWRLREHMERIMRFDKKYENTRFTLSSAYYVDEFLPTLAISDKIDGALVFDEKTGVPEVARFDFKLVSGPDSIVDVGMRLNVEGLSSLKDHPMYGTFVHHVGILDENVLRTLSKAQKDVPPSPELHMDVVLMHEGRVVLANHYDRQTYSEIYRDLKPYIFARAKNDFILNHRNVKYQRLAQKQMTNDVGLPVMIDTQEPIVTSFKFNYIVLPIVPNDETRTESLDLSLELKLWRHGEYSLSTYNPIADSWHAFRRNIAADMTLPLRAIISMSPVTDTLKIRIPALAELKNPYIGLRQYVKDTVAVEARNATEKLKSTCPRCEVEETVHDRRDETPRWSDTQEFPSLNTMMVLLDCQISNTRRPVSLYEYFYDFFNGPTPWSADSDITMRQKLMGILLYPRISNCGFLTKIEPGEHYPPISVEIKLHRKLTPAVEAAESYFVLHAKNYKIDATLDAISSATNASVLTMSATYDATTNDGHTLNEASLRMQLKTEEFTRAPVDIRFCVDAKSNYQPYTSDLLRLEGAADQESTSSLKVKWSESGGELCGEDLFAVRVRGQLSKEQISNIGNEPVTPACVKDILNRERHGNAPVKLIPMTLNCLNEAITYTTLRKYTIEVEQHVGRYTFTSNDEYIFRKALISVLPPDVKLDVEFFRVYNMRFAVEFLMGANTTHSRDNVSKAWLENYNLRDKKAVAAVKPMYFFPLENTRFSTDFLDDYIEDVIRLCVVHPHSILTADEKNIPFELSHDKWTLVTGEPDYKTFAVFAKSHGKIGDLVATKIYVGPHRLEILPDENGGFTVTLDGQSVTDKLMANTVISTSDPGGDLVSLQKWNDYVVVELPQVPLFSALIHPRQLMVTINRFQFEGKVSGLCGKLVGTYTTSIPEFYTLE